MNSFDDLMRDYVDLSDLKTMHAVFDEVRKLRKAITTHMQIGECVNDRPRDLALYVCLPVPKTA